MWDVFWFVVMAAACAGMLWFAFRMEPHWVSKDGQRFTCRVQQLGKFDLPEGRWREMRGYIEGSYVVVTGRGMRAMNLRGRYTVVARSPDPPKKLAVWLLARPDQRVAMRMPDTSRACEHIDAIAVRR